MEQTKTTLKTYFETNDVPTQAQFSDLIDSLAPQSIQTFVQGNSATWELNTGNSYVNSVVQTTSGNWNGVYTTVQTTSADWANIPKVYDLGTRSGSVSTNTTLGSVFTLTITGSTTLENPQNAVNGQSITWHITQGTTGSHTISLGDKFKIPRSATNPLVFSVSAGDMDIFGVNYSSTLDKFHVFALVTGY